MAALVPPGVVTKTLAVPAVPAGVVAVMVVELTTVTLVAAVPPMVTAVAPVKSVPVMVMVVPPAVEPLVGEIFVTVGGAVTVAVCPVKARLFKSTLALLEPEFAVMISSLPSRFTSPKATERGLNPVAKSVLVPKVPLPLPKSMLALAEP